MLGITVVIFLFISCNLSKIDSFLVYLIGFERVVHPLLGIGVGLVYFNHCMN